MYHPFLIGEKIYLRGLERSDLEGAYFQWLNDYDITKHLESGIFPNSMEAMEKYFDSIKQSPDNIFLAIIERETDRHIGNIKIGNINWVRRVADIGWLIGEKDAWGKGYGTEALKLVVDYCFRRLNLHKVFAGIAAPNLASKKMCEKVGFSLEATLRKEAYVNGEYCDVMYFGLLREEYKL